MRYLIIHLSVVASLLIYFVPTGFAQDVATTPQAEMKEVNDWMAKRALAMGEAYKIQVELTQAWGNPKYTSEEIEAQRKKYRQLENELMTTQLALKREVKALAAYLEREKKLEEINDQVKALTRKIEARIGSE